MATSTPVNANSAANISPVGPPPAITTACSVMATTPADDYAARPEVELVRIAADHSFVVLKEPRRCPVLTYQTWGSMRSVEVA
jgi:hypothetical protein